MQSTATKGIGKMKVGDWVAETVPLLEDEIDALRIQRDAAFTAYSQEGTRMNRHNVKVLDRTIARKLDAIRFLNELVL